MTTGSLKQNPCTASVAASFNHGPKVNLTYDLSNCVTNLAHNSWTEDYLYSPDNRRIWRSAGQTFCGASIDNDQGLSWNPGIGAQSQYILYSPAGQKLGVYCLNFSPSGQYNVWTASEENVYWGSRLVAKRSCVSAMGHFITDRLHSKGDGSAFYPYGESKTGAAGDDREQFATYTRDQSSGLDYADQRWYSSRLGRFLTTDPFDSSFSDARPTSANRYSYVESDPGNLIDPTGLLLESPGGSSSRTFDPCYLDGRDFCGGNIGGGGGGPVLSSPQDLALAYGLISPGQSLNTGTVNWELLLQSICAVFVLPSAHTAVLGNLAGLSSHSLVPAAVAIPILIDIGVSADTVINTTGATITVGVLWATLQELFRKKQSHSIDYPRGGIPGERDSNGNCVMTSPPYPRVKWRAQGNAHGSTAGYHWHWMDWDLNLATCMWFAKRRAGPTDPGPAYQEIGH